MDLIQAEPNPFGGVVVDPGGAGAATPDRFRKQLARSLEAWRSKGYKVVWLEVPISRAALVPVAVDSGFTYHHADASNVLLTLRLEPGSFIPPYATHYVGVGGVVVNEANELLVVSERYKEWNPGRKGFSFKLPGGALRRGEHVAEAAVPRGLRRDRNQDPLRVAGVLSPLARLSLRQVRHLLRVPPLSAQQRDRHAGRGNRGLHLDADR